MKSVNLPKLSRFYIWIIVLILAVIAFILLRSPAAGQLQAAQNSSSGGISEIDELSTANQQSDENQTSPPNSSSTMSVPPNDNGSAQPLPELIPYPTYPRPIFCPLGSEGPDLYGRCDPCRNWPYAPLEISDRVCLDL